MRTIKFRAKPLSDSNVWVYGYIVQKGESFYIVDDDNYIEVDPNTIGQYIGIKDLNGVEVYEGDKLSITDSSKFDEVIFNEKEASFVLKHRYNSDIYIDSYMYLSAGLIRKEKYERYVIKSQQ